MNSSEMFFATEDQLRLELEKIQLDGKNLDLWRELAIGEAGRFLKAELEEKLEIIRSCYGKIPVTSEHASLMLAGLQAQEYEVESFLKRLQDADKFKKELDSNLEMTLNILRKKQSDKKKIVHSILPTEAKEYIDDARRG